MLSPKARIRSPSDKGEREGELSHALKRRIMIRDSFFMVIEVSSHGFFRGNGANSSLLMGNRGGGTSLMKLSWVQLA